MKKQIQAVVNYKLNRKTIASYGVYGVLSPPFINHPSPFLSPFSKIGHPPPHPYSTATQKKDMKYEIYEIFYINL